LANHTILIARDGRECSIDDSCGPIRNSNGEVVGAVLVFRDITERRAIENKLQETRVELERVVQAQKLEITDTKESLDHETKGRIFEEGEVSHRQKALEAVYAIETGSDSNIETLYDQIVSSISTTLRAPFVAINEYRDGKMVRGSLCLDGCVSRSTTSITPCAACRKVLDNKHPSQFYGDLASRFGGNLCFDPLRFQSFAGVPINGPQGKVFGVINVLDIKNRIYTDSEITFIETFARYIAHELSRRDLEVTLRRGEEMRLLGNLTSGVAHEVRNPLNGILAIMGALSKEFSTDDRFVPYMKHLETQVDRLSLLMEDLLVLGKPLPEENFHEISMVTLIENAISAWLQTKQLSRSTVRFVKPELSEMCMVAADKTSLTQIVINLLDNAHNHSEAGTEIICMVHRQNNHSVIFYVTDKGTGIAEKNLPRIFDPFFTTRKGGTGLGLSIVRTIVESHKGSIRAYNNADGPGATFEVVLPLNIKQNEDKKE
jgi:signal transduction histidine kinase